MEQVGVEAVLKGLESFLGGMGKMDKSIRDLIPGNSLLEKAFLSVGDTISKFASSAVRTLEYALGQLLADAIKKVISFIGDLIKDVIDAGDEFSRLQIRLQRLNFNALTESGMEYNEAMKEATRLTKEQLDWTIRLGAKTPYDAKDIANIYTLALGYGFTADEAKGLTEAVIDFASGMGLTNVELERVVINFGQLRQQGKLNGQDLRDLARGAFVPINKILAITAEKLGLTTEEFNKLKAAGKLSADQVDVFIQSFEEFVGINFKGAAEALGTVFSVAAENVRGMIRDMLASYVVFPVFMQLGGWIQGIVDAIADSDTRWNKLVGALQVIGQTITLIVDDLLEMVPSTETIADKIVDAVQKISAWFFKNHDVVVEWVRNAVKWFKKSFLPTLQKVWKFIFGDKKEGEKGALAGFFDFIERVAPGVEQMIKWIVDQLTTFSNWVTENKPLIDEFFSTLGEIVSDVLEGLFGETPGEGEGFLGTLKTIMQWVIDNKDGIAEFIENFVRLAVVWEIVKTVGGVVIGILLILVGVILSIIGVFTMLGPGAVIGLALLLAAVAGSLLSVDEKIDEWGAGVIDKFKGWWDKTVIDVGNWATEINEKFEIWKSDNATKIKAWADEFNENFKKGLEESGNPVDAWAAETLTSIQKWADETKIKMGEASTNIDGSVKEWTSTTLTDIQTWFDETQKKGETWSTEFDGTIKTWASTTIADIRAWGTDAGVEVDNAIAGFITKLRSWGADAGVAIDESFADLLGKFSTIWEQIRTTVTQIPIWFEIGADMLQGIIDGVVSKGSELITTVVTLAVDAYNALTAALQTGSPSKLFMEVGYSIDEGLIAGITGMAKDVGSAMGSVMGQVTAPAMAATASPGRSISNSYQNTRNYNLNITSGANSEDIISDYNMLESLAG